MSDEANEALARLDDRIAELQQALQDSDWQRLGELNGDVRALIDPVMAALEQRQLSATAVQERLGKLDTFVKEADGAAREARQEAREALEQVGQNRKAANAYARVSHPKK
ncbi:SOS cell division inhibitor [Marinobacter lacisalsi]|uniref:SOS cell division inhibitor n=1 Tax=Marinobacter lacisalsi TaxID=475979 RepID=A0ABV8QLD1_9GAMM